MESLVTEGRSVRLDAGLCANVVKDGDRLSWTWTPALLYCTITPEPSTSWA